MKKDIEKFARQLADFHPLFFKAFNFKPPEEIVKYCLGIPQIVLLERLRDDHPKLVEVAKTLSVSPAMVTHIVDDLEKKGLIKRISDVKDRRVKHLSLTPKGKYLIDSVKEYKVRQTVIMMEQLASSDRESFVNAVTDIMDIFTRHAEKKNNKVSGKQ